MEVGFHHTDRVGMATALCPGDNAGVEVAAAVAEATAREQAAARANWVTREVQGAWTDASPHKGLDHTLS